MLLLNGCARPKPVSTPAVVTFKTPSLRIHDTAFVTVRGKEVGIEVYTAGKLVLDIHAGSMVCINDSCLSDDEFIAKYLSPHYPARLLGTIARKELLEMGGDVTPRADGFMQRIISNGEYDITYIVRKNEVFFRDRENGIIIAIKTLE